MHWLESKYTNLLSSKLLRFKKVQKDYNCRCPLCGDSKKNPHKARGWILFKNKGVLYHCFNCGVTLPFRKFLKTVDQSLYDQYQLERLKEKGLGKPKVDELQEFVKKMKAPKFKTETVLKDLKKVSQLPPDHPAKQFIMNRQIPTRFHHQIYYCPQFWNFLHGIDPEKYKGQKNDEGRIIIPILRGENLIGFQGRTLLKDHAVKYMTVMLDENAPKLFLPDKLEQGKPIFAFEGPIDSYFIDNSLAACGGSITSILEKTNFPKEDIIVVYDNEPRSKHTVQKIEKAINSGFRVCLWPSHIQQKDINDMVLNGLDSKYIENTIITNSAKDLEAKLRLASWKQI